MGGSPRQALPQDRYGDPQQRLIHRERLLRQLGGELPKVVLVIAPAGYGKTTLALQMLRGSAAVWLRCTSSSRDPIYFAREISGCMTQIGLQAQGDLDELLKDVSMHEGWALELAQTLRRALDAWPPTVTLVLDDYHNISGSGRSEEIAHALAHSRARLTILSRRTPSWASARNFLYREYKLIDARALALTRAESARLLKGSSNPASHQLAKMSLGWTVFVALAGSIKQGLTSARHEPLTNWIRTFLAEEVLVGLDERTLGFLSIASSMATWNPELLTALASRIGVQPELLQDDLLERGILVPGTHHEDVFIHPLVRAYLNECGVPSGYAGAAAELLDALLQAQRPEEAFALSLRLGSAAIDATLARSLGGMLEQGQHRTIERWLTTVDTIADPRLTSLVKAEIALRRGHFADAEAHASVAISGNVDNSALLASALLVAGRSAHLAQKGSVAASYFRRATEYASTRQQRSEAAWGLLLASLPSGGDPLELRATLHDLDDSPTGRLRFATGLYETSRFAKDLKAVAPLMRNALPYVTQSPDPFAASSFLFAWSNTLLMAGRYRECLDTVEASLAYAHRSKIRFAAAHLHIVKALAQASLGLFEAGQASVSASRGSARDPDARRFIESNAAATEARIALMQGNPLDALHLSVDRWNSDDASMRAELLCINAFAELLLGHREQAVVKLALAEQLSRTIAPHCLALAATALDEHLSGRATRAVALFEEARDIGCFDPFVMVIRAVPELLNPLLASERVQADIRQLLTLAEIEDPTTPTRAQAKHPRPLGLTPKETEVCEYLLLGMTNKAIASDMHLTEATIKLHLKRIFAKLGVSSRTEAVIKLMQLQFGLARQEDL